MLLEGWKTSNFLKAGKQMAIKIERKSLFETCSGEVCCASRHSSEGTANSKAAGRGDCGADLVWWIREQLWHSAPGSIALDESCSNIGPPKWGWRTSIWIWPQEGVHFLWVFPLGGMPGALVTSECLKRSSKGTLALHCIPKVMTSSRTIHCLLYLQVLRYTFVNYSYVRYIDGRTKVSQIPGNRYFSKIILFRIISVPQKCCLLCLRMPCSVFKWIYELMDWY